MPKKVMILINTLMHGGAERIVVDIAENINKSKFDLHIVYMKDHKYFKEGYRKTFLDDIEKAGIKVTCLGGKNRSAIKESIALWKLLRKERPDILQTFLAYSGTLGRVVGRIAGVRSILSAQCNLKMAHTAKSYWLDKLTLPLAQAWTAATEMIEEEYDGNSQYYTDESWDNGRRHFTILAGVDVERIQAAVNKTDVEEKKKEIGVRNDTKIIAMCARLIGWKGHEDLLNAFALLPKNIELVLIGGGSRLEALQRLAEQLGVNSRTHFLGNRNDLFEILAVTDVYVQSYTRAPDGSVWKGPNTSQMTAAACKVPAVSTRVPFIERFIQDGISGKIAELNDPQDLALMIQYMLNNPVEAEAMANKAFEIVSRNYSLKTMMSAYESIYARL